MFNFQSREVLIAPPCFLSFPSGKDAKKGNKDKLIYQMRHPCPVKCT